MIQLHHKFTFPRSLSAMSHEEEEEEEEEEGKEKREERKECPFEFCQDKRPCE